MKLRKKREKTKLFDTVTVTRYLDICSQVYYPDVFFFSTGSVKEISMEYCTSKRKKKIDSDGRGQVEL